MHVIGQFYTKWINHLNNDVKEITVIDKTENKHYYRPQCRFFIKEETNELFVYENEYCDMPISKEPINELDLISIREDTENNKVLFINDKTEKEYNPKSEEEVKYIFKRHFIPIIRQNKDCYYNYLFLMDLKDKLNNNDLTEEEKDFINEYIEVIQRSIEFDDECRIKDVKRLKRLYDLRRENENE